MQDLTPENNLFLLLTHAFANVRLAAVEIEGYSLTQ